MSPGHKSFLQAMAALLILTIVLNLVFFISAYTYREIGKLFETKTEAAQ